MKLFKKAIAELIGTFVLVAIACGTICAFNAWQTSGVMDLAAKDGVIASAFGLCLVAMAYSVGNVSGCHINPAVSFGVLIYNYLQPKEKRTFCIVDFIVYVASQIIGSLIACYVVVLIFGPNCGFGANQASAILISSGPFYQTTALGVETLLTAVFVFTILGVTTNQKYEKCAGLIIGITLTLVHIIGIPLTGTSVNPARSIGPAIYAYFFGGDTTPLNQLWIFIAGPLLGALVAALLYWFITFEEKKTEPVKEIAPIAKEEKPVEEKKIEPLKEEKIEVVNVSNQLKALKINRIPFSTKLKNADKDITEKYKIIKDALEGYGLKGRVSFEGDTYRLHRVEYCFITIRGKSLKVYYRLDPKAYENTTIPVKDEGDKKKYVEVPCILKVRSNLSAKRAIELVDDTMSKAGILRQEAKDEDDKK